MYPKSAGPPTPPAKVPHVKKSEIARARISKGKISLTVRYAELAADDAMKKTTLHATAWVKTVRAPRRKSQLVTAKRTPDAMYVIAIIFRRPTVSKRRPRMGGPRKF